MYVFLRENSDGELYASALIPVTDVPIEERFTAEFLSHCVYTDEEVHQGWIYEDGHFHEKINEEANENEMV